MHGGLCIVTKYIWNGDTNRKGQPEIYTNQEIVLSANCNEASISLFDEATLTPAFLRKLADELEKGPERAREAAHKLAVAELTRAMNGG